MTDRLSRLSLLRAAIAGAAALAAVPREALGAALRAPVLRRLRVRATAGGHAGDRTLLATVSPGVPGRSRAVVSFELDRAATVRLEAVSSGVRQRPVVWETTERLRPGEHELRWDPEPTTPVGSYLLRVSAEHPVTGARRVYGGTRPATPAGVRAPVVRVLGVEAAFERRSYAPLEPARLRVSADARQLTLEWLHCGTEPEYTDRIDEMRGNRVGEPVVFDWQASRRAPRVVEVEPGPWQSGVYAARLTADDGRVGFAPLILRPPTLGTVREAVVMPTNTWQAYNFYDADGDGWGDTWYAGGNPPVDLRRPYRDRGVPPRWRRYDVPFLKWLLWTSRTPDILSEDDLEAFSSGDDLRGLYDLVAFPGHTEYVTQRSYDVIERYRDLGGRLIFLSANNFFWKVEKRGEQIRRVRLWRELGRPEARLLGVQYKGNDDGTKQAPYFVIAAEAAPWLFEGTGLGNGSKLGEMVGGYGIEVDGTTRDSPPGTKVLALVPSLFGPGLHGEMAYYETPAGARVFSAGTLDFGGSATFWPVRRLLDNLWRHMLEDVPPLPGSG